MALADSRGDRALEPGARCGSGWSSAQARLLAPATLIFDTFLFTALLYLTGGPDNPFSALYTVQVAMAAMTGSARATWLVAGLSAAGYAAVFRWHETYHFWHGPIAPGSEIGLHAVGMWIAVTVVAVVITYFIVKITNTLRAQEATLRQVGELAARNARLASLTTLAAGAAHELGSPLGTIAVIAGDLAREAERSPGLVAWADDARLLRAEVDRCRAILDRMSARVERVGAPDEAPLRAGEVPGPARRGGARRRRDAARRRRVRAARHRPRRALRLPGGGAAAGAQRVRGVAVRRAGTHHGVARRRASCASACAIAVTA